MIDDNGNEVQSPEPWRLVPISDTCSDLTAEDARGNRLESDPYDGVGDEDWKRIVACVNVCQGIPTDKLLTHQVTIYHNYLKEYDLLQPTYFATGTMPQMIEHAKKLLQLEHGCGNIDCRLPYPDSATLGK